MQPSLALLLHKEEGNREIKTKVGQSTHIPQIHTAMHLLFTLNAKLKSEDGPSPLEKSLSIYKSRKIIPHENILIICQSALVSDVVPTDSTGYISFS